MAEENVTIRIKIADYELEVQRRKKWAEKTVREFIERIKEKQTLTLESLAPCIDDDRDRTYG